MSRLFKIARDIFLISLGKYGQYLITLLTIPITARALGVEGLGFLAIGTGAYFFGSALVDFGLTQLLAAKAATRSHVGNIRAAYAAWRGALLIPLLAFLVWVFAVPEMPTQLRMIALGLFCGGLSSCGEDWVLIGRMKYGRLAGFQIVARIVYLGVLVTTMAYFPTPTAAILCLGLSSLVSSSLTWISVQRTDGVARLRWKDVRFLISVGWPAFTSRIISASYQQGATVLYSTVVAPSTLGLYSSAEKIVRAAASALDAVGIALLPRMAKKSDQGFDFWPTAKRSVVIGALAGAVVALIVYLASPIIIDVLFGNAFESSKALLQAQVFALPAVAISSIAITSILYVKGDTPGVLWAAITGLVVTALVVAFSLRFPVAETLAWGLVATEWTVAIFALARVAWLYGKDVERHSLKRTTTEVGTPQ